MKKQGCKHAIAGVISALVLMLPLTLLRAEQEWWTCPHCDCNRSVSVTGDFRHSDGLQEGIRGRGFRISVPGLDPGTYRVMIGRPPIENGRDNRFDVFCNGKVLFRYTDPCRQSRTKVVRIRTGEMLFEFTPRKGDAELGSLEIVNSQGQSVVSMEMRDLKRMR